MPYVDMKTRERLDGGGRNNHPQNVGQLTYDLQRCLKRYQEDRGLSYQTLAECLGALEGAKCDLNERIVQPYENRKCEENGDVWPDDLIWGEDAPPNSDRQTSPAFSDQQPKHFGNVHTCSAECPCQTGGTPTPDFLGDAEYDA